jgi:TetR/AcrR family transcriptional repressor of nem operon
VARPNVRDQIVSAAYDVLYEKGFNGCSVQDITAAAEVPKGSFYNHFESKEALGAVIVDRYDAANELLEVLHDESLPALDRLRRYFDGFIEILTSVDFARGCLLGNFSAEVADHSPLMRERLAAMYRRWTASFTKAIADGQRERTISRELDAATLATVLLDAFEGAILRARVERGPAQFDGFLAVAFGRILSLR